MYIRIYRVGIIPDVLLSRKVHPSSLCKLQIIIIEYWVNQDQKEKLCCS